jgi:hypothetical protein
MIDRRGDPDICLQGDNGLKQDYYITLIQAHRVIIKFAILAVCRVILIDRPTSNCMQLHT